MPSAAWGIRAKMQVCRGLGFRALGDFGVYYLQGLVRRGFGVSVP